MVLATIDAQELLPCQISHVARVAVMHMFFAVTSLAIIGTAFFAMCWWFVAQ